MNSNSELKLFPIPSENTFILNGMLTSASDAIINANTLPANWKNFLTHALLDVEENFLERCEKAIDDL